MKRFILRTLFMLLPILLIMVAVNYFGDAAHLFDDGYAKKMAGIIDGGKYVTNISNYDERLFEREMANKCKRPYDVLILGSSRTMLIGSGYFKNERVFNASVSRATIEDQVAIYQMYKARNMLPRKILLCVDPWLFNKNNGQTQWGSLYNEYSQFFRGGKVIHIAPLQTSSKYRQLLSRSYFQSSLKTLYGNIKGINQPKATSQKYNKTNTELTDGSATYAEAFRNVTPAELNGRVQEALTRDIYSIGHYDSLSPDAIKVFNMLVDDCKKQNITLAFILQPYHPAVYAVIKNTHPTILKAEDYVIKYAAANNIRLYGSYDPAKPGLDANDFFDGMHDKDAAIKKILARLDL